MNASGRLQKMLVRYDRPVRYALPLGDERILLNDALGSPVSLRYTGRITCIYCGRKTGKSYNQGYCYRCFQSLARCDSCVMSPEKCHYFEGTCREPVWGEEFCMQDHIVYLANSSGIKVGLTRTSQIPTRWIDQGAVQALPVLRVRTRQQAGFAEEMFRRHITDRTNWRAMLKGEVDTLDLMAEKERLLDECRTELEQLRKRFGPLAISVVRGVDTMHFEYPVLNHPASVKTFDLDKDPEMNGELVGIKGQYLILDTGVINIRKYTGYHVEFSA